MASNKKGSKYIRDSRSPVPKSESTSRVMRANVSKDTEPELAFRRRLRDAGHTNYRLHKKGVPGRPDIVFSKQRKVIFINGCFWHRCPHCRLALPKNNRYFWKEKFRTNVRRDKKKIAELEDLGWKVFTIWECDLDDEKKLVRIIKNLKLDPSS